MLAFKATLRWWDPTGEENIFQGTIRLMDSGETIAIHYSSGSLALPKVWTFSSHKLKSTNARARVVLLLLENGTRVQLTMGITGNNSDPGKAVVEFFERATAKTINN